jgi:hypothetical protein
MSGDRRRYGTHLTSGPTISLPRCAVCSALLNNHVRNQHRFRRHSQSPIPTKVDRHVRIGRCSSIPLAAGDTSERCFTAKPRASLDDSVVIRAPHCQSYRNRHPNQNCRDSLRWDCQNHCPNRELRIRHSGCHLELCWLLRRPDLELHHLRVAACTGTGIGIAGLLTAADS